MGSNRTPGRLRHFFATDGLISTNIHGGLSKRKGLSSGYLCLLESQQAEAVLCASLSG
jgi:hypothetical protein